ncbi:MAG: hypothetical protein WA421_14330 [Nitrososphaeraceae archaeon]
MIKFESDFIVFAILTTFFFLYAIVVFIPIAHANNYSLVKMTEQSTFRDSNGSLNVVGVVDNNGQMPVGITVGLNTTGGDSSKTTTTIKQSIYGRIIYPFAGAPFKFVIGPERSVISKAFITNINQISVPHYNVLRLNYSSMPIGDNRALVGTAKNVGPFDVYNVTVYASAHNRNGTQLDSVRSNVIPVIKHGMEVAFTAKPYPSIRSGILYYSCAGVDLNAPITTLDLGKGQFIAYDLRGLARISDFKYDNKTDSIVFGVNYYSPNGGPLSLKIPQVSEKQSVSVIMDGKLYKQVSVGMDGKTVSINFFVPPEDHQVQIKGIKSSY